MNLGSVSFPWISLAPQEDLWGISGKAFYGLDALPVT